MAQFPSLPLFTDAIMADCLHLTDEEFGLYMRILITMWRTPECRIPAKAEWLEKRFKASITVLGPILVEFCYCDGNYWVQKRLLKEFEYLMENQGRSSNGGRSKWKVREDKKLRSARMSAARDKGTHTGLEWLSLVEALGNKCVRCSATGKMFKDHIIPIYQGGSDAISNLQPLCQKCSAQKGPETIDFRNPLILKELKVSIESDNSLPPTPPHPTPPREVSKDTSTPISPLTLVYDGNEYTPDMLFDLFWGHYPQISTKGNKGEARANFKKLLEKGEDHGKIINGCRRYSEFCKTEGQYNKHASVFLNAKERRWLGEWEPGLGRHRQSGGLQSNAQALAEGVRRTMRDDGSAVDGGGGLQAISPDK